MEIKTACFMFTYKTCQLSSQSFSVAQDTFTYSKEGHLHLQMKDWISMGLQCNSSAFNIRRAPNAGGFPFRRVNLTRLSATLVGKCLF